MARSKPDRYALVDGKSGLATTKGSKEVVSRGSPNRKEVLMKLTKAQLENLTKLCSQVLFNPMDEYVAGLVQKIATIVEEEVADEGVEAKKAPRRYRSRKY